MPESCPVEQAARVRQEAIAGRWSALEFRGHEGRHFLDGEPIHCNHTLELQVIEPRDDDYGMYHVVLQRGCRVRYELSGPGTLDEQVLLHTNVGGHVFTSRLQSWMRFRWPKS